MKTAKQLRHDARRLFRLCFSEGSLDEGRVRQVMAGVINAKRRGYLAVARQFERLVRLELLRHAARVESATPLAPDLRETVEAGLAHAYGSGITTTFAENPALIGGMRIRVGSDVYDGSVQAGLASLEKSL
jgi:F-type H+-transporting ATPase subunit delta